MAQATTDNDKNPKPTAELERLRREFDEFRNRTEAAFKEAMANLVAIREAAAAAAAKADAADRRATAAEVAAAALQLALTQSIADVTALKAALGNDPSAPLPPPGKLPPFLTVPVRDTEFDPVCKKALDAVLDARKANVTVLADAIVTKGIASAIGKVSQTLGRSRMSEARRHILAAAFPDLINSRLGTPIQADLAKDPPGLVQSLLIDLEAPGGPLDHFAELVVAGSETSLSLNLQAHERAALKTRVRASV